MLRLLAAAATILACCATSRAADKPPEVGDSYMRVEQLEGGAAALQIAIRKFVQPDGDKPPIYLAGVIHLGDRAYYVALQEHLDAQGLVLFEGVGQPGFLERDRATEAIRRDRTRESLRFLTMQIQRYRLAYGGYPLSLNLLAQEVAGRSGMEAHWTRTAMTDAWGRPVKYRREADRFTLTSFGSDGKANGKGAAADVVHTAEPLADASALPAQPQQIQATMAAALGLVFQLDVVNYDRPHFRNSDISLRRLQQLVYGVDPGPNAGAVRLDADDNGIALDVPEAKNEELRQTLELLSGESATAGLLRIITRIVGLSPKLQSLARLMLVEMLGNLDGDLSQMQGMPEGVAEMMKVLIRDRNRIVMRDLKRVLESDDPPASISIFYGAGHMTDLEVRLVERLGYKPADEQWLTAFTADADETGLSAQQVEELRAAVRAQMKMMMPQK